MRSGTAVVPRVLAALLPTLRSFFSESARLPDLASELPFGQCVFQAPGLKMAVFETPPRMLRDELDRDARDGGRELREVGGLGELIEIVRCQDPW